MEQGSTPYQQCMRLWWGILCRSDINSSNASPENNKTPSFSAAEQRPVNKNSHKHCGKQRCMHRLLNLLIPSVYAQDVPEAVGEQATSDVTIAEKLRKKKPNVVVSDEEIQDYLSKETGRDRLRAMFSKDDNTLSDEIFFISTVSQHAGGVAFLFWSVIGGMQAKEKFIREHQHTKYLTKFRAFRAYNDAVFLNAMRTGLKWGIKVFFFTGMFLMISTSISVYRNKSSVLEYIAGGALVASFLRLNLGPKGFFAGGIIGGTLGLVGGSLLYTAMWLGNETQEQRHYWHVHDALRQKHEARVLSGSTSSEQANKVGL